MHCYRYYQFNISKHDYMMFPTRNIQKNTLKINDRYLYEISMWKVKNDAAFVDQIEYVITFNKINLTINNRCGFGICVWGKHGYQEYFSLTELTTILDF